VSSMRAVIALGAGEIRVDTIDIPTPGIHDVLVKVHGCSLCGSDLKLIAGDMEGIKFPLVPGHEWSGTVVDAPSAHRDLVGRRVVADILQNCGRCDFCHARRRNLCSALIEPGLTTQGAFAEYIVVPAASVRAIPDGMSMDEACLAEPLSVVMHAFSRAAPRANDVALVLGGGGVGLITLAALKRAGVGRVALMDPHVDRQEVARLLGADWAGHPSDNSREILSTCLGRLPNLVINAASRADGLKTAVTLCDSGGTVCQIGYTSKQTVEIRPSDVMTKELRIIGALSPTYPMEASLESLRNLGLRRLLTHDGGLEEFSTLFELAKQRRDGAIRVLIRPAN